jgi:hypothetical protein
LVTATGSTFNVPVEEKIVHLHPAVAIVPLSSSASADFEHFGYLELIPAVTENDPGRPRLNLRIPICAPDDSLLYVAVVKVYAASTTNRFIEKILNTLMDVHRRDDLRVEGNVFEFFGDDGRPIDPNLETKDLLAGLLNGQFFARWRLDKADRTKVTYRTNPIQEFFETEPEMVSALKFFEEGNAVSAFLGSLSKVLQSDWPSLLTVGQKLRKIHIDLLSEMEKHPNNFFFPIGRIVYEFLDVLTSEYIEYASYYRPIEKELFALKNSNHPAFVRAAKVFREKTETDPSDILMRPIQRLPRYRMLFQTVYKYTQVHHPDHPWVKKCLMRFEVAQKKADRQADRDNLQLRQILGRLDPPREAPPDSVLLDQFSLQSENEKWRFLFLSTGIWILLVSRSRLEFRSAHEYLDFSITPVGRRRIVCWQNVNKWDTMRKYDLQTEEFRDELSARYRSQYRIESDARREPFPVRWSVASSSSVRELGMVDARVHHSMVVVELGDDKFELLLFGGLTGSGEPTDATYRLCRTGTAWGLTEVKSDMCPSPRYHAAMVWTPYDVFLFGGTTNGTEGMDDFWRLTANGWEAVVPAGECPPPGFALDLAYFKEDTLLLTGGIDSFNFYKYSIRGNIWVKIKPSLTLPAYRGHRVFPIGEGTGLIVNGHTSSGNCNDAIVQFTDWGAGKFVFVLCRGMPPSGRVWGSAGMIGNHIVVVGGEREVELCGLDLRDQVWHFSKSISLDQPAVYGAAVAVFQNRLYVHGGSDDASIVLATLYEGILEGQSAVPDGSWEFQDDGWRRDVTTAAGEDEPEKWIQEPG